MSAIFDNDDLLEVRFNFIEAAKEKLDYIESLILNAESQKNQTTNKAILKDILSHTHALKGAARGYKFDGMALICNKLVDYISELVNQNKIVSTEELTKILKYTDLLAAYCDEFALKKTVDDLHFQERLNKQFPTSHVQQSTPILNETSKEAVVSIAKAQILIVGINNTIMKQIYMALVGINHNLSFSADPLEALHRISVEKFDLIVSSYMMDPINGISFSLAIKNQWNEKAPRIILLSSENVELKHEKKLQPDKVFVKSLSLPRDLQEYFDKELSSFVRSKATTQNLNKHLVKSVFIVEDDVNILELFLVVFTDKKDVVVFNEVTKWDPFERIAQLMPDLIICDIHVPNVDTKSLLLKIKTSEELREIPVVFFSGDPEQPIATELIRCGALAVLDKTIILTSMFDELEKLGIELHTSA